MILAITIILLLEFMSFRVLQRIIRRRSVWLKIPVFAVHIYISLLIPILLIIYTKVIQDKDSLGGQRVLMILVLLLIALYIPRLLGAIIYLPGWILGKIVRNRKIGNWFASIALFVSLSLSGIVFWGHLVSRFNYRLREETIPIENLPESFRNYTIVHISDIHLPGFFGHTHKLSRAFQKINKLKPDLLVVTGDWISIQSEEMVPFIRTFRELEVPLKYGILGNHDYGLYDRELSLGEQLADQRLLKRHIRRSRFRLLSDEHVYLHKGQDSIILAGVENWGNMPFPQYGDLQIALKGINKELPVILLSHDPSHWRAKVLPESRVDLTLSGHTHGGQFGIKMGRFTWSPVSSFYDEWGGLYRSGQRYLYVNTGLGTLGFPGRIGMRPEITLLTLVPAIE